MGGRRRTKGASPRCDFASAATKENPLLWLKPKRRFFVLKTTVNKIAASMNTRISLRVLCQVGMLIALAFVLERLFPIVNTPTLRITLAFIPMMCCGMLFGPVWGAVAFGISDILGWPIMGLMPIPLILVARVVNGFLFGLILHRENLKLLPHAVVSAFSTQVICGMGLTTLGLAQFLGSPYFPFLMTRLPQFVILIVLQIVVFPVLIKLRSALRKTGYVTVLPY